MNLPPDIVDRIAKRFSRPEVVYASLARLQNLNEKIRVIRCILELSDSDYDAVDAWTKTANEDYRNVIWYAEYDNRNIRKYDFALSYSEQKPYAVAE